MKVRVEEALREYARSPQEIAEVKRRWRQRRVINRAQALFQATFRKNAEWWDASDFDEAWREAMAQAMAEKRPRI